MKYIFHFRYKCLLNLLVLFLLLRPTAGAQAPSWQAAVAVGSVVVPGSPDYSVVSATAADAAGNIFLTGTFSGTVSFGSTTFTSLNINDLFVAKWSTVTRQFVWAQHFENGAPYGCYIAVNGPNVYVTGNFSLTAAYGPFTLPTIGLNTDVFVLKLVDGGSSSTVAWVQPMRGTPGGRDYTWVTDIKASGNNIYIGGNFNGLEAHFGNLVLNRITAYSNGFVAKLEDDGATAAFAWAEQVGGNGSVQGLSLHPTGVYAVGNFNGTVSVGSNVLTSAGASDLLAMKLLDNGSSASVGWAQRAGGSSNDYVLDVASANGALYLTGMYSNTTTFGTLPLVSAGLQDAFVAKLTDAGSASSFTWARSAGGTGNDAGRAVAVDAGSVYVTGDFEQTFALGTSAFTTAGNADTFVARLTDTGPSADVTWCQQGGGALDEFVNSLVVIGNGVYVAGEAYLPSQFGTLLLPKVGGVTNSVSGFIAALGTQALATTSASAVVGSSLFPNPAHGRTIVQLPVGTTTATLTLLDALGRTVLTQTTATTKAELDLIGLPAGLYAVRVQEGGRIVTQRLVVE